jgi:hypothetical protein
MILKTDFVWLYDNLHLRAQRKDLIVIIEPDGRESDADGYVCEHTRSRAFDIGFSWKNTGR